MASDVICGGEGNDIIWGRGGSDYLGGGPGDDRLHGERGADWVRGGFDIDYLFGNLGDDRLNSRDGFWSEVVSGGWGSDLCIVNGGDSHGSCRVVDHF